jgi:tetratricopeptide (TPR) repeat protein
MGSGNSSGKVSSWARASRWTLAVAIAGSALAIGSVHTESLCVVTLALGVAVVLGWWRAEPIRVRPAASLLLGTGVILTGYTALQCLPLPIRGLAWIAPYNADIWSRVFSPLHEAGPTWAPLSLDPPATRVEVLKGVAYLLTFVAAVRIARRREGVAFLSNAVLVTAVLLAIAALLHPAFGAHKLYGLFEPGPGTYERHIAPLMNPNNLSGYLNLALCLALAATIAPEPRLPRAISGAAVLLLGATQIWVASRGGIIAMILGVIIVLAVARVVHTRRRSAVTTLSTVTGLAAAVGAVLVVLGTSDAASTELSQGDVTKLQLIAHTWRMFPSLPLFGCGRGAFESVYPAFNTDVGYLTYTHPENVIAQWILEWGLPLGALGLVVIGYSLRPGAVLARSTTAAGAWAGLAALGVQNLADLGTEIPGLVIAAVVLAAIVVGGTPGNGPSHRMETWAQRPRYVTAVAGGCAVVALLLGTLSLHRGLHDDRRALHAAAVEERVSAGRMHALAREAMGRHPAEPYLPFIAGLRAWLQRDDNPLPWLGATLDRSRVHGPAHLLLARTIGRRGPAQARLEYRLSMEQMPEMTGVPAREVASLIGGFDDAMEAAPTGRARATALELLVQELQDRLPAACERMDGELAKLDARLPSPNARSAMHVVDDLNQNDAAPWCTEAARRACIDSGLEGAARVIRGYPQDCLGYALRAQVLTAAGEARAGITELAHSADQVSDRTACLRQVVSLSRTAGETQVAAGALDSLANAGCSDDAECARNLIWVARNEEEMGNARKSLVLYRRALERTPQDDTVLESVARLAAETGLHGEAAEDYERLAQQHPDQARWVRAAGDERAAAMRDAVGSP